jgi:hypothetical protein
MERISELLLISRLLLDLNIEQNRGYLDTLPKELLMRIRVIVRSAALFLCLVVPLMVRAQFQEPSKDELSMTVDPKAPGAAAVFFNVEEKTDDMLHYHSYYARIKVLTEKGKEAATVRIPYDHGFYKVTDIRGRTIHPDGAVIPLKTKASDLVEVKVAGFQENTIVFTLPDVQVGSILEYFLEKRYDDKWVSSPDWPIQQPYFVHKAHYFFQPSREMYGGLLYAQRSRPDSKVVSDAQGRYSFDITDVPPIPNDDWMPPLNSLNWHVEFYYTPFVNGSEFWQDAGKKWAKETNRFANPSKAIQNAVAELVAPADTEEQKARKLYNAVMKLDNTNFTREKSEAERKAEKLKETKDAEIAWLQKSGSANDLALLYVAMAKVAGLQAFPMEVVNRDRAIFDPNYLTTYQLDDYIVIVSIGGKEVYLDPGQKLCSFGLLHWKHTMAGGLRMTAQGPRFSVTPSGSYAQNAVQRVADLQLGPDGSLKGTIQFVLSGQDALRWRQLTLRNDEDEVKKRFNEWTREFVPDGVDVTFDHFLALDQYDSNLMGLVKVNGGLGTATGKRYFLPGLFFESRAAHPFVAQDRRETPVDMHYAKRVDDEVVFHLPPGFSVESTPQSSSIPWPNSAVLKITSETAGDTVTVKRSLAYNFTLLDPKDYTTLHDFYQKVASADQQQLVLTRATPTAKGN